MTQQWQCRKFYKGFWQQVVDFDNHLALWTQCIFASQGHCPITRFVTSSCFASSGKKYGKFWAVSTWFTCVERIRIVPGRQNRFYEAAPVLPAWNGGDIVGGWKIAKSGAALEDTLTAIPFNHCHWQSLGREIKTSYPRYLIWCWTRVISNTLKKPCHSCR